MEFEEIIESQPNLRENVLAKLGRLYPLKSGCGTFANTKLMRFLSGNRNVNLWAGVRGGKALVPIDDLVGRSMYFVGDLDPKTSWVVDRFVRPGDVTLDVGANLGLVSLHLASKVGSKGQVHAFEPNPGMIVYLKRTLCVNSHHPITLHEMGLGNEETTLPLGIPTGNLGRASFLTRFEASVDVPVRRLTDYASEIGLSRIDFIKLDVEGFETEVLRGGLDLIRETRPRAILLEEHAPLDPLPPSLQLLKGLGYRLFLLPRTFLTVKLIPFDEPGHRKSHDYVAVQPEVRLPA